MRASIALLLLSLLVSVPPARAAEAELPGRDGIPPTSALDAEERQAYLWSLGGTVVPLAAAIWLGAYTDAGEDLAWPLFYLGAGAVTVGPSLGQFRAGSLGHGLAASALRGAGEAIALVAILRSFCFMCDAEIADAKPSPAGGMALGAILYLAGTAYSLANIHHTYEARRNSAAATFRITPTLALDREKRFRPGAALSLSF